MELLKSVFHLSAIFQLVFMKTCRMKNASVACMRITCKRYPFSKKSSRSEVLRLELGWRCRCLNIVF